MHVPTEEELNIIFSHYLQKLILATLLETF